jgi:AraC-like DNA-binding protein
LKAKETAVIGRFETAGLAEKDRFPAWRDFIMAKHPGAIVKQPVEGPFHASVAYCALPHMNVSCGQIGAVLNSVRGDHSGYFSLFVNLGGHAVGFQRKHEFDVGLGDAFFMAYDENGGFNRPTDGAMLGIRVSHEALGPLLQHALESSGRPIPRNAEGLNLLRRYVQLFGESELLATERERALVSTHILDLLALVLGAAADMRELAGKRGARAALVRTVAAHVGRKAQRNILTLESVSTRFGVSPRTIQRALAEAGTTFTDLVQESRLSQAYRMLTNRRFEKMRVGDIALTAGFEDISYFNRLFRRHFGKTPNDVRKFQQGQGLSDLSQVG